MNDQPIEIKESSNTKELEQEEYERIEKLKAETEKELKAMRLVYDALKDLHPFPANKVIRCVSVLLDIKL